MNLQDHFSAIRKVHEQNLDASTLQNSQDEIALNARQLHDKIFKVIGVRIFVDAKLPISAFANYDRLDIIITNSLSGSHLKCIWNPLRFTRFKEKNENKIVFEFSSFESLVREIEAQEKIFDRFRGLIEDRPGQHGGIAPGTETVQSLKDKGEWK